MQSIVQDFRFAFRALSKNPGFAAVTVLTLALGIAANTAIFSVMNALFFHPPGIDDPARVVAVRVRYPKLNLPNISISATDYADVRDSKQIFAFAAALQENNYTYNGNTLPERLQAAEVTWQFFETLGAKPALGRGFVQEEDAPGANHVVVLSHATWERLFGGDPNIAGKSILLDQQQYRVAGVMAADFKWPHEADIWVPMGVAAKEYGPENRFNEGWEAVARLAPGVSYDQASAFMKVLTERIIPTTGGGGSYARSSQWGMFIEPFSQWAYGELRMPMLILSVTVGFVLLICCANVAGLMLAKASGRAKELAIRTALGARRVHLARQVMVESLVMALGGTVVGVLLAWFAVQHADAIAPANSIRNLSIPLDRNVLLFSIGVGLVSAILFGMAPALLIAASRSFTLLKEGGRSGSAGGARQRVRSTLVVGEIAIALVLLVGAGLFLKSLVRLQQVAPGFDSRGVMTAAVTLSPTAYNQKEKQQAFYANVANALNQQPGVQAAALALGLPFSDFLGSSSFRIQDKPTPPGDPGPHSDLMAVTDGYFKTLSIPLRAGRYLSDEDRATSEPVVVIDENLARTYFPNEDPIGKRVGYPNKWATIVGVVAHTNRSSLESDSGKGVRYYSLVQFPAGIGANIVVRTSGDPRSMATVIRQAVASVDPSQVAVYDFKPMEERVAASLGPRRFAVTMLATFAAIALVMAALGLYGVISYAVAQRTQEIGIRMALGAKVGQVLVMVLGEAMKLVLAGIAIGLIAGVALARLLASQLVQVSAFDPLTFAGMAAVLALVTIAATYLPARRAAKVDPMVALRYE